MKNLFDISQFVDVRTPQQVTVDLVNRFRKRRKEAKITQRELAKRSGVSYASIRRFETTGDVSLASLIRMADAVGMLEDFDSLFANQILTDIRGDE